MLTMASRRLAELFHDVLALSVPDFVEHPLDLRPQVRG